MMLTYGKVFTTSFVVAFGGFMIIFFYDTMQGFDP
jgi:hypothetical protein